MTLVLGACAGGDGSRPPGAGDDSTLPAADGAGQGSSADTNAVSDPCTDFAKRDCTIDLGVVNGVHNCTKGVQICEKGQWTTCAVLDP